MKDKILKILRDNLPSGNKQGNYRYISIERIHKMAEELQLLLDDTHTVDKGVPKETNTDIRNQIVAMLYQNMDNYDADITLKLVDSLVDIIADKNPTPKPQVEIRESKEYKCLEAIYERNLQPKPQDDNALVEALREIKRLVKLEKEIGNTSCFLRSVEQALSKERSGDE